MESSSAIRPTAKSRDRVTLTLSQRYDVLQELADGASVKRLVEKFGVAKATLYKIVKQRDEIEHDFLSPIGSKSKKRDRRTQFDHIDEELLEWYLTQPQPVSIKSAVAKARELGGDDINKDWVYRWKSRKGFIVKKSKDGDTQPFDIDDDEDSDLSEMYAAPHAEHDDEAVMYAAPSAAVDEAEIMVASSSAVPPPPKKKKVYPSAETLSTGEAIEMLTKLRRYAELNEMTTCAPHYEELIAAHYDHMLNITTSL